METNNATQWAIIGAAVVILVAGGAWLLTRGGEAEPADTEVTTSTPTTVNEGASNVPTGSMMVESDGESIVVSAQAAGTSVVIDSMELTRASWVAVRDDRSILGAAWFASNATTGSVKLQRATVSGTSYRVVIYVDDGDKKFDFKKDQLIAVGGAPVGTTFIAQ